MKAGKSILAGTIFFVLTWAAPTAALGQTTYPGGVTPTSVVTPTTVQGNGQVRGESVERDGPGTDVLGEEIEQGEQGNGVGGSLPLTGGDLVGLAAIGLGALAVGTVLVRRSRSAA